MNTYQAPIQDMSFLLFDVFKMNKLWQKLPVMAELIDKETAQAVLQETAKMCEGEIAPLLRVGDEEGVTLKQGEVTTPSGYQEAFNMYVGGGWPSLGGNTAFGAMGMPKTITAFHEEMLCAADISFSLYVGLTAGAALAIDKHGSNTLKEIYLTRLYQGDWSASMCLTEANAGSDLGLLKTKAVEQIDGSYQISGEKIFITAGEHDLTENIIHLVLARTPDAPKGHKGISMFLVPKYLPNKAGEITERNKVFCTSLEKKMGIHASATCVLNFDQAKGYLIGELNQGLNCMFTMMNFERLGVGLQGLGAAERSYQNARHYAKERLQGRSLSGIKSSTQPADNLLVHGDVRRMLLNIKALNEGCRALSCYISMQLDLAHYGEGEMKQQGLALSSLMTPLAKAFFTDCALESTLNGQQIFGGHGYIREWGQEQLVRDTRISQIYEGTNGIQAMDLLARKVVGSNGELMNVFLNEIDRFVNKHNGVESVNEFLPALIKGHNELAMLTEFILSNEKHDKELIGCVAYDYLHVFGYVACAFMWAKMVVTCVNDCNVEKDFQRSKLNTARYYYAKILPRILSLSEHIKAGSQTLFDFDDRLF